VTAGAEVRERVRAAFAKVLELALNEVPDDAAFYEDLGGDSLGKLDLAVALESEFFVKFTDEDVAQLSTVSEVVSKLQQAGIT